MQIHLTDIDDFPSRCDAWMICFFLLFAFVFIFLQCLMAYIKRFFGTVYFKIAPCYLWRVERLCVYDQNANTTNLHSVILDDMESQNILGSTWNILDDTTRLTVFFEKWKQTSISPTFDIWHILLWFFSAMA